MFSSSLVLPVMFLLAVSAGHPQRSRPTADGGHAKAVAAWREKHEADYRRDYVPLAGLFFLEEGSNPAGSAPSAVVRLPSRVPASVGEFVYREGRVRFVPAPDAPVLLRDARVSSPVELRPDGEAEPRDELRVGDLTMWVHKSGDRRAIRLRDPQSDLVKSFTGFRWYPIDPRYRVTARFVKDPAPREVRVPTLSGDDQVYSTEGTLVFTLAGRRLRVRPMTTRPGRLFLVFRDATSGRETYGAARFLYADLQADGTAVLDFNQAYNPPCAFNPYTTCPLPLRENRLTIPIPAGELDYREP